jgi:hypothetical protein
VEEWLDWEEAVLFKCAASVAQLKSVAEFPIMDAKSPSAQPMAYYNFDPFALVFACVCDDAPRSKGSAVTYLSPQVRPAIR